MVQYCNQIKITYYYNIFRKIKSILKFGHFSLIMNIWFGISIFLVINLVFLEIIDDPIECLDYDTSINDYSTDYDCMNLFQLYNQIELVLFFLIPILLIIGLIVNTKH